VYIYCLLLMPMLTNNQVKQIASLQTKKFRQKYGQFVVEGKKSIQELLGSRFVVDSLVFRKSACPDLSKLFPHAKVIDNIGDTFNKLSSRETPGNELAIVDIPSTSYDISTIKQSLCLLLDDIQDPGNLGTIVRLAAWYGIQHLLLTTGTADILNPKTIQSSMGGFSKIHWYYKDKNLWIEEFKALQIPLIGADMQGDNVHHFAFPSAGILVIGNEGKGISNEIEAYLTSRISIPGNGNIESLNAAMATAIILDNWYRIKLQVIS
jgi:TrmH family RNA methyltransferase